MSDSWEVPGKPTRNPSFYACTNGKAFRLRWIHMEQPSRAYLLKKKQPSRAYLLIFPQG